MQLHARAFIYLAIQRMGMVLVLSIIVGIFVAVALAANASPGLHTGYMTLVLVILGIAVIGVVPVFLYSYFLAHSYRVELRDAGVQMEYGLINIVNELLLYDKIQDVVITRDVLERAMSLATVTIQNAMGRPEQIPGLGIAAAEGLREQVLGKIRGRKG